MHLAGADLHFHDFAFGADHGGMQGLIAVFLGVGDIVVEFVGNMAPQAVHNAQGGVAVPDIRHQQANSPYVVNLGKVNALATHFSPDAVNVLDPPGQLRLDASAAQLVPQVLEDFLEVAFTVQPFLVQLAGDFL